MLAFPNGEADPADPGRVLGKRSGPLAVEESTH